jgi:hypothetical protein
VIGKPPPPLATNARLARPGDGDCTICGRPIGRGARVATLPDDTEAHLPCIAAAASRPARNPR